MAGSWGLGYGRGMVGHGVKLSCSWMNSQLLLFLHLDVIDDAGKEAGPEAGAGVV